MAKTHTSQGARKALTQAPAKASRGTLTPMRSSEGFRDYVCEQLSDVRELVAKPMFGGVGFYSGEAFFGILAREQLYLKVGDANRAMYEAAGSAPFKPYADRTMTMTYWEVPVRVLEDADELCRWARMSIALAQASPAKRKRQAARPGAPRKVARPPA